MLKHLEELKLKIDNLARVEDYLKNLTANTEGILIIIPGLQEVMITYVSDYLEELKREITFFIIKELE